MDGVGFWFVLKAMKREGSAAFDKIAVLERIKKRRGNGVASGRIAFPRSPAFFVSRLDMSECYYCTSCGPIDPQNSHGVPWCGECGSGIKIRYGVWKPKQINVEKTKWCDCCLTRVARKGSNVCGSDRCISQRTIDRKSKQAKARSLAKTRDKVKAGERN